jgi:KEOPS complex subunit Pcc1
VATACSSKSAAVTSRKSASSKHDAVLTVEYADGATAHRVERALSPEVGDIDGDRTTVRLARDGATLDVTVEAADLVALRAGLNTWLSLVSVAETTGGNPAE